MSTRVNNIWKTMRKTQWNRKSAPLQDFWASRKFSANYHLTIKSLMEAAVLANAASDVWGMLKGAQIHTRCLCHFHSTFPTCSLCLRKRIREENWKSEQHWAATCFLKSRYQDLHYHQLLFLFFPPRWHKANALSPNVFLVPAKRVSEISLNSSQRRRKHLKWNTSQFS